MPEYYKGAELNHTYFNIEKPICTAENNIEVLSSTYYMSNKTIEILYKFTEESRENATFSCSNFNNPVRPETIYGFNFRNLDKNGYIISEYHNASITQIYEPNLLKWVKFSFAESNQVGVYSPI